MDGAAWLAIMAYEHRVHDWGMKFRLVHVPAAIRRQLRAHRDRVPALRSGRRLNRLAGITASRRARSWIRASRTRVPRRR